MEPNSRAQRGRGSNRRSQRRNQRNQGRNRRGQGMNAHQRHRTVENPRSFTVPESQLTNYARYVMNVTCQLPITTRGIGLIVSRVTSQLRQYLIGEPSINHVEIPVAAIYRLSLAQLEWKMYKQRFIYTLPTPHIDHLFERPSSFLYTSHLERHTQNLSAIALVIDSIGNVTFKNKTFSPVFYKEESPFNLRIRNLRAYCDKMGNPETPSSKRVEGFEFNSIPNARWKRLVESDPESVVLDNPDEIISSDYLGNELNGLREDAFIVQEFFASLHYRLPEITGNIEYGGQGDPSILVSTHVVRGQNLVLKNDVVSGNASEFWAPEPIPQNSWKLGVLALTGEVLDQNDGTARSNVEGFRCFLNWRGIADCVL